MEDLPKFHRVAEKRYLLFIRRAGKNKKMVNFDDMMRKSGGESVAL